MKLPPWNKNPLFLVINRNLVFRKHWGGKLDGVCVKAAFPQPDAKGRMEGLKAALPEPVGGRSLFHVELGDWDPSGRDLRGEHCRGIHHGRGPHLRAEGHKSQV